MTTNTNTKANQQPVDDNNDDNDKNNQNDSTNLFLAVSFLFLLFLLDFCFKNNPISLCFGYSGGAADKN